MADQNWSREAKEEIEEAAYHRGADFMLANRRAARLEEIAEHGWPVSFRKAIHKSKKVYDRNRLKRLEQKLSDKSE